MALTINSTIQLNNGMEMPLLGLGAYLIPSGDATISSVGCALGAGYRHIDTAMIYDNEAWVGTAVRQSGISRSEIFIATKLWNTDHGTDATRRAFDKSLRTLGLDYIDLYLIHWPVEGARLQSWRVMEELLAEGRARAIGVSNYMVQHLEELLDNCDVPPAVNQIELNPYNFRYRAGVVDFCRAENIRLEAYCPLVRGLKFDDPRLVALARKYDKSPAQILIRWALQEEIAVIPKSIRPERIEENADVYDFSLSGADMDRIRDLNEDLIICWDPTDAP